MATASTFWMRSTERMATRSECPAVVGSRSSTAATARRMNWSKSRRIRSSKSAFSKATAAWLASELARSASTVVKGMTSRSISEMDRNFTLRPRFLLMSWTTPMTSFSWSLMGTTSIDLQR